VRRDKAAAVRRLHGRSPRTRAQQPAMPVIGFIDPRSLETTREQVAVFHRGLAETGYVEGRNLAIEDRWADNQIDRLPAMASDLVRERVAVIAATGGTPGLPVQCEVPPCPLFGGSAEETRT
jgi:hypothetical protein